MIFPKINMWGGRFVEENIFLMMVLMIILKVWIVYVSYNQVVPKVIASVSGKSSQEVSQTFVPLDYQDCILLLLLTSSLSS